MKLWRRAHIRPGQQGQANDALSVDGSTTAGIEAIELADLSPPLPKAPSASGATTVSDDDGAKGEVPLKPHSNCLRRLLILLGLALFVSLVAVGAILLLQYATLKEPHMTTPESITNSAIQPFANLTTTAITTKRFTTQSLASPVSTATATSTGSLHGHQASNLSASTTERVTESAYPNPTATPIKWDDSAYCKLVDDVEPLLDTLIEPCSNFYGYACGKQSAGSIYHDNDDQPYDQLEDALSAGAARQHPIESVRKAGMLYHACIKDIGGWNDENSECSALNQTWFTRIGP